jgi:undecaprenyl-diphosphatase
MLPASRWCLKAGARAVSSFDSWLSSAFNSFVGRSWTIDAACVLIASNVLIKGAWIVAVYPLAWLRASACKARQAVLVYGVVAAVASIGVARLIGALLPFRVRPIHEPALHLRLAFGLDPRTLLNWTSFPSDHAALFAALATTLLIASPGIGILACCYVLLVIDLPRIYLGLHYPTDILAGTCLGAGMAALARVQAVRDAVAQPSLRLRDARPGVFYAGSVLLLYLIGVVFDPLRDILRFLAALTGGVLHRLLASTL